MGINRISMATTLLILVIVILLTALYFYPAEKNNENNVMPEGNGWRMIYGNPQGTCVGDYNTSYLTGKILWSKHFDGEIKGLLVNGNVLYALVDSKIISLNGEGKILWELNMDFSSSKLAMDRQGNIYAVTKNGDVVSLDENGHIRWVYSLENNESAIAPLIVQNNRVYIITNSGALYILNDEGNMVNMVNFGARTSIAPVISPNGNIYIGVKNSIYKVSPQGSVEWNLPLDGKILRMAFYEEHLYVTTLKVVYSPYPVVKNFTPYLFSLSQNGRIEWKVNLDVFGEKVGVPISLAVYNNSVYVGTHVPYLPSGLSEKVKETQNHSFIMKFNPQGHIIWKRGFYNIMEGLAVSRDGFIYTTFSKYEVMSGEGLKIYALNSQGSPLWQVSLNRTWTYISAPIIGLNAVYISASYYYYPSYGVNYIYAIG